MSAAHTPPVVVASGATKQYHRPRGALVTVGPVDVTLGPGEFVAVFGSSRSGKTTLVNLLAGWEAADAGTVTWPGAATTPPAWRDVAVVPQALVLLDELTVAENVSLPLRARGAPAADVAGLLADLDLAHLGGRRSDEISVGERQRVMVARALVGEPRAVLADDPVAHQDDRRAGLVVAALAAAAARGVACLAATRTAGALTDAADRVVRLG